MNKNWSLENALERKKEAGETFSLPNKEDIKDLIVGDVVKLIFIHPDGGKNERMRVQIHKIYKGGEKFSGSLVNEPSEIKNLRYGDEIDFQNFNIISIYDRS